MYLQRPPGEGNEKNSEHFLDGVVDGKFALRRGPAEDR